MVIKLTVKELKDSFTEAFMLDPTRTHLILYNISNNGITMLMKFDFEFYCRLDEKKLREFYDGDTEPNTELLIERFHTKYLANQRSTIRVKDIEKYGYI